MLDRSPIRTVLDLEALNNSRISDNPFRHVIVPNFIRPEKLAVVSEQFPTVDRGGSVPLPLFNGKRPIFMQLIKELRDPAFRAIVEEKLGINLTGAFFDLTTRSRTRPGDGFIHPDSSSKVVSGLIYPQAEWKHGSLGALRLLRSSTDKEDYTHEIPPNQGTLLLFRRSDDSFHGYKDEFAEPSVPRQVIQFNWFRSDPLKTLFRSVRLLLKRLPIGR